ncbi:MAG: hypothetical protein JNK64_06050 [Myxococcales bacterium]|nr:hypothetical protein [Myxococcales bacterium]
MSSVPCPSCGVAVTAGYPRCPRCHAPMPGVGAARGRRDTNQGGGTTVKERPSRWSAAALAVALVAVVAGVVALVLTRGAAHHTVAEPTVTPVAPPPLSARTLDEPEAPSPDVAPVRDPWPVLDRLERAAASERLYLKATARGASVELRSSFCGEARVEALVDAALPALREQGIARVTCVELHGAAVFARTL